MSAMYRVTFEDGRSYFVHSADTKSATIKDRRTAYSKARRKAEAKRKREGLPRAAAVSVNCVG